MEAKIYNQTGKEAGSIKLPESIFGLPWNGDLVHQVITSMLTNSRTTVAHTKNRGDVRGGGKKPWRQKGTGRARHGSSRSPLWVGGGVTHGPRNERNYSRKVNKKMKAKALFTILSKKWNDGEVLFISELACTEPKTKEAVSIMSALSKVKGFEGILTKKNNSAYINLAKNNTETSKSFRNLNNVLMSDVKNINPVDLMNYKYVLIGNPAESLGFIEGKISGKDVEKTEAPVVKIIKPRKTVKAVAKKPAVKKTAKKAEAKK